MASRVIQYSSHQSLASGRQTIPELGAALQRPHTHPGFVASNNARGAMFLGPMHWRGRGKFCKWKANELVKEFSSTGKVFLWPTHSQGSGAKSWKQAKASLKVFASSSPSKGVVITGASKGLGFALAQEFLKHGDKIVVCSRTQEGVDKTVAALATESSGGQVFGIKCDVGSAEDIETLREFARDKLGTVHLWLNNAGQVTSKRLLADVPVSEIQSAVSCNVMGSLLGSRAAVQLMREQPGATEGSPQYHVFNFGFTEFGAKNTKSATTHKATKTSLMWLTRSLLHELKEAGLGGIGVHNCSPGMVLTDLLLKDSTPLSRRFFNALAEEPETVAAKLVPKLRELRSRDAPVEFVTPLGAVGKIVTGLPQILQGGRFFDKEGNRVRQPGADYAENGVRLQAGQVAPVSKQVQQQERTRA